MEVAATAESFVNERLKNAGNKPLDLLLGSQEADELLLKHASRHLCRPSACKIDTILFRVRLVGDDKIWLNGFARSVSASTPDLKNVLTSC